jgi:hypothetical protein
MTRRRLVLALAAVGLIVCGLIVSRVGDGAASSFAGDSLYAALLYVVVAIVVPRMRWRAVALAAFAICAAVEFFQLTGIPADMSTQYPGASLVLGTTFQWSDLLAYALGAATAGAVDGLSRRATKSSRGAPTTPSADAPPEHPPAGTPSR